MGPDRNRVTPLLAVIETLASGKFTPASIAQADKRHPGVPLREMVEEAKTFAEQLKETLVEIERTIDPDDPQLAAVRRILAALG